MIRQLQIENFILTEELSLVFDKGFNAITGETGAGKSVVIGALEYLTGKNTRTDLAYNKDKPVHLEAVFSFIDENAGEQTLTITRQFLPSGKSVCRINGNKVSQRQLNSYGHLVDFHSQREQINLFDNRYQLDVLDNWAGLRATRKQFTLSYNTLRQLTERKKQLLEEERATKEKLLLYEFQIEEIEKLSLVLQQEKELSSELDLLTNAEELLLISNEMHQTFIEQDNSIADTLSLYLQRLQRTAPDNETIRNIIHSIELITEKLGSLSTEIRHLENSIELDNDRLIEVEANLNEILRVKNKYKMDVPRLLDYLAMMKEAVSRKTSREEEITALTCQIDSLTEDLFRMAEVLTDKRKEAATCLSEIIIRDLAELFIPDGVFSVDIRPIGKICVIEGMLGGLNETGNDKVEFIFSANKGLPPQKLQRVVSGGELSRLLMIIKKTLAERFASPTLVLDEIDSGIGGKTANKMGSYIAAMSSYHQVICITHLPQIASNADKQFLIRKSDEDMDLMQSHKTVIKVKELTQQERKEEIARMLAGTNSEIALRHAEEILKENPLKG